MRGGGGGNGKSCKVTVNVSRTSLSGTWKEVLINASGVLVALYSWL